MLDTKTDVETTSRELTELLDEVDTLLTRLTDAESTWSRWLTGVAPEHRSSCAKHAALLGNSAVRSA